MFLIACAKIIDFAVSKNKNFSHFIQSAITHSQSFRGNHNASFLPSPQFSLSDAPLLGAQGGDQSPLLPVGVGPHRGLALGLYLILWPFLVSWSVPPMSPVGAWPSRESEHWSIREPGIPSGGMRPPSSQGSFTAPRLSQQSSDSRGRCCWNLGGASRNVVETSTRETKHLESWRTQIY